MFDRYTLKLVAFCSRMNEKSPGVQTQLSERLPGRWSMRPSAWCENLCRAQQKGQSFQLGASLRVAHGGNMEILAFSCHQGHEMRKVTSKLQGKTQPFITIVCLQFSVRNYKNMFSFDRVSLKKTFSKDAYCFAVTAPCFSSCPSSSDHQLVQQGQKHAQWQRWAANVNNMAWLSGY